MITHPTFTDYIIFRDGKVMNKNTGKVLSQRTIGNGYLRVALYKDKKRHDKLVHRLMMQTYNPIENDHLYHAHHIDEIEHHNHIGNLRWELIEDHLRKHKKGVRRSDETIRKISEAKKNISDETRKKLSESQKGHLVSDETRKKLSEANKGKVITEETRRRISEARTGSVCWNNGVRTIRSKECPGEGWTRGKCKVS